MAFDIERFRLTPEQHAKWVADFIAARERRLLGKTPEERATILAAEAEAEDADAWREALADELWGKA